MNNIADIRRVKNRLQFARHYYHGVALAGLAECGRGYVVAHIVDGKPVITYFPAASVTDDTVIPPALRDKLRGYLALYNPQHEFIYVIAAVVGRKCKRTVYIAGRVVAVEPVLH